MQDTQVMQGVQGMKSEMTGMHAPIPAGIIGMREFTREFLAAYLRTSWVCMRERQRERERERECVSERACVCVCTLVPAHFFGAYERETERVCESERERECACVCVYISTCALLRCV